MLCNDQSRNADIMNNEYESQDAYMRRGISLERLSNVSSCRRINKKVITESDALSSVGVTWEESRDKIGR